jgi:outer membrane protein assembly factor BamD
VKKNLFVVCAVVIGMVISSCSSTKEIEVIPLEQRYQHAMELYQNKDYLEAIEEFKIITVQNQGSDFADVAQFYIAECRYDREEYILAAAEYDNLIRTMPSSKYVAVARYKKALSYYNLSPLPQLDQKYTRSALDEFQTYVEYSPKDSLVSDAETKIKELTQKLAEKLFNSGRLYYRIEYYKAAIVYFDRVIAEYRDSKFVDKAMYWKAVCQTERKKYDEAEATINELLTKFPETDLKQDIADVQKRIQEGKSEQQEEEQSKLTSRNE